VPVILGRRSRELQTNSLHGWCGLDAGGIGCQGYHMECVDDLYVRSGRGLWKPWVCCHLLREDSLVTEPLVLVVASPPMPSRAPCHEVGLIRSSASLR
jgi:hypothetical protein